MVDTSRAADRPKKSPKSGAGGRAVRSEALPTAHDLAQAKEDSLLQLQIGRTAHYYTLALFAVLFADGLLLVYLNPFGPNLSLFGSLFYLVFPLAGAILLTGFGLSVKWEAYQIWPWEGHFWVTVLAAPLSALLVYLYVARLIHWGPTAEWSLVPGFLPLVLLGITVPLSGLVATWGEWTRRKAAALLAAALPIPLALILYIPASSTNAGALTLTLVASGGLFLSAGSLLHLISSGTQAHEREVIVSGQSRLFKFSDDLRGREEALRFRESTLLRREADAEVSEAGLARKVLSMEDVQKQFKTLELDIDARAERVHQELQQAAAKMSEASQIQQELAERQAQLGNREQAIQQWETQKQVREKTLSESEGELVRRQMELATREKDSMSRQQVIPTQEARIAQQRQDLEKRWKEVLQKEAALKGGPLPASARAGARDSELATREARAAQVQQTIQEQSALLGRKARDLEERTNDVRRMQEEQARREQTLVAREKTLASLEGDLSRKGDSTTLRQKQYDEALKRVEERSRTLEQLKGVTSVKVEDFERRSVQLQNREAALRQQQEEVQRAREDVERALRLQATRERELESRDAELSLRGQTGEAARDSLGATTGETRIPPMAGAAPPGTVARAASLPPAGSSRPAPLKDGRASTGLGRLDELLLGGLPPKAQVILIGPPFTGKEILLYTFLSEGLKRGESVIVVSTSRGPGEVAQEIGMVMPQFREFEQLGRVHWIDASNPSATPTLGESGGAVHAVVKGPGDYAGILAALAAAVKRGGSGGKERSYRVGVMSLSACIAQGDEKSTFTFLPNIVGILKQRNAMGLYLVDPGTLSDAQVESTLSRMEGAVHFKQDRGKTVLSIQGLGEVATRDWVEYRATNRSLTLGSFALERIR
jgi:hypothetical protein